jgi:hypothetical protein
MITSTATTRPLTCDLAPAPPDAPRLLEEVARSLLHAQQLGHLTDNDRQGEANDETLQHRLRDERRNESQPQQCGEHAGQTSTDRECSA